MAGHRPGDGRETSAPLGELGWGALGASYAFAGEKAGEIMPARVAAMLTRPYHQQESGNSPGIVIFLIPIGKTQGKAARAVSEIELSENECGAPIPIAAVPAPDRHVADQ